MSIVESLSQPLWQRLGLTLVHFLWQGLAVAVLAGAFVRVFRLNHGNTRYAAYLLAFIAMIVCPVVTFTALDIPISPNAELVTGAESTEAIDMVSYTALPAGDFLPEAEISMPGISSPAAMTNSIPLGERISGWLNVSMPWILVIWMVGVIVLSVRLVMGFVGVYRWRHHLEPLPERLAQRIASLSEGLCMRGFSRVFISPSILQAMAVGYLRPMALLPAAMVMQMQPEMLEAVIAHELAHIRRFDLWINLAQRVIETLLFYHPAVWWLSNCLRRERELCCDELAVKATGERITYASTLESVGRARLMAKQPILAAGLGQDNKPTLGRVRHILGLAPAQRNCPFWLAGVIAVLFLAALVIPTTLALTNQSDEKLSLKVETADGLPVGWKLDYDDGSRGWRSGMADNLAELRIIPTPANEYDESWKEERIRFEIHSLSGKHVGDFHFLPNTVSDRIVLAPDKYVLSYTRGAVDLQSNCTIPLDSTKFEVDLSGAGMYQLRFTPKLKDSGTVISDKYPPTTCKGKVIDVNGNQLGRIKVAAYEMFFNMAGGLDMRLIGETITKADGAFVFETRPSVKKTKGIDGIVVAEKEGLSVGWADWPLYGEQKVTIMLGKPTKLAGFVVDENGEGIANAEVRSVLFKKKNSEKEKTRWLPGLKHLRWLAVRTDRKGRFEFNNIPDDARSDLIVSAEGFGTVYTHKPENLSTGYEGAEFIAGQTDIRVELTAEGRIEGKVIDSKSGQGVAGVKLAVVPTFSPFFFERFLCISREDGTFSIGGLRSGEYVIRGDFPKVYANVKSGQKTAVQVEGDPVQDTSNKGETLKTRTIYFPKDQSLGMLYVLDANQVGASSDFDWGPLCEAAGEVSVPAGKVLRLDLSKEASGDLSPLSELEPNDLAMLFCCGTDITDEQLKHISHLTGLQEIDLSETAILGTGLKYLFKLKSLRKLDLSNTHVGDDKLAYLSKLPSLEVLSLWNTPTSDAGMVHVGRMASLKVLGLSPGVGNEGLRYLKNLASLRWLSVDNRAISDEGLAHLADLTQMETLYLNDTQVSDAGLVYLKKMAKLKTLFLYGTRVTEKGLIHLEGLKELEELRLLYGVTDTGLMALSKLTSLKNVTIDGDSVTTKGLTVLSKMKSLEHVYVDNTDRMDEIIGKLISLSGLKLKELTIGTGLTDKGLIRLKNMQSLQKLTIGPSKITGRGIIVLAELPLLQMLQLHQMKLASEDEWAAFGKLSSVQRLILRHIRSRVTNAHIAHLADMKSLRELSLDTVIIEEGKAIVSLDITDQGLAHLLKLKELESLSLRGAKITDEGIQQLEGLSSLKWMDLQGCSVTEQGLQRLKKKLPALRWFLTPVDVPVREKTDVQIEGESEVSKLLASLEDEKYAHTRGWIIPLVEENGQELLDKLRSYDSAFLNSQTISMEMEKPVNWARADERQKIKIALTTDNGSIGWEEEISYLSGPRYKEGLNGIDRIQYVWNVTRKQGLIENDFQARRREMVLLLVSPWGDFAEKEAAPVVEFRQSSDRTKFIEYTCVIWSTGRGFADHLKGIIEAKKDENGLIHFTAHGNFGPNSDGLSDGLWEMVVDPKSGYLVRSASFTGNGHKSPVFICTTIGTKWFDNCSLAKEARFSTWDKSKITTTQTVQFKLEPDAKLFDKLRKTLRSELPKDTRVEDCR